MAATKSRSRRAIRSTVDGVTSVAAFVPGLAAKALSIVEAGIDILDKAVSAALKAVAAVRGKLEDLEEYLSDYAGE